MSYTTIEANTDDEHGGHVGIVVGVERLPRLRDRLRVLWILLRRRSRQR